MRYHENLNIVFMRDNGPRHSIRIRHNHYYFLLIFFISMPFVCICLGVECWRLWQDNRSLHASIEKFESQYLAAEARAARLENVEELLREEELAGREIVLRNIQTKTPGSEDDREEPTPGSQEGPGHEEFPALDTGRVHVSNVQARSQRGNRIRIALDLRNPDNDQVLSGIVGATLITANGEKHELVFDPGDVGAFKINRFKRTVMVTKVPDRINLADSEVILEVKEDNGEPIYRNIFAVQSQ